MENATKLMQAKNMGDVGCKPQAPAVTITAWWVAWLGFKAFREAYLDCSNQNLL